jgi:hypothetical protein
MTLGSALVLVTCVLALVLLYATWLANNHITRVLDAIIDDAPTKPKEDTRDPQRLDRTFVPLDSRLGRGHVPDQGSTGLKVADN